MFRESCRALGPSGESRCVKNPAGQQDPGRVAHPICGTSLYRPKSADKCKEVRTDTKNISFSRSGTVSFSSRLLP